MKNIIYREIWANYFQSVYSVSNNGNNLLWLVTVNIIENNENSIYISGNQGIDLITLIESIKICCSYHIVK